MAYTYYRRYQPTRRKNSSFKPFFWFVLFLFAVILILRACVSIAGSLLEEKKDEAIFTLYKGEAEVLEWGQSEAESASDAQLILEGDQVSTSAEGWGTLTFYNGTRILMDDSTTLLLSEVHVEEESEKVYLSLIEGRIWIDHNEESDHSLDIQIETAVMNIQSVQGQYLLAHQGKQEALFVEAGPVTVEYMDRSGEERTIETVVLKGGEMSLLDEATQIALQARENVNLVETAREDLFVDDFVLWATGKLALEPEENEETVEEPEEEPEEELVESEEDLDEESPEQPEEEPEAVSGLVIQISSPSSGASIQKDAIALEGQIVSGTASRVTVTWSGNGVPYDLGFFEPGSTSFRYVADANYANFAQGTNTYTIVAYDENGQPSNTVVLTLYAEF